MSTSREGAKVAALVELAEAGIPPDIQELLTLGNPLKGVAPGALWRAFARFEREVSTDKDEMIANLREALRQIIDAPMIDHSRPERSAYGIARTALTSTKKEG